MYLDYHKFGQGIIIKTKRFHVNLKEQTKIDCNLEHILIGRLNASKCEISCIHAVDSLCLKTCLVSLAINIEEPYNIPAVEVYF